LRPNLKWPNLAAKSMRALNFMWRQTYLPHRFLGDKCAPNLKKLSRPNALFAA